MVHRFGLLLMLASAQSGAAEAQTIDSPGYPESMFPETKSPPSQLDSAAPVIVLEEPAAPAPDVNVNVAIQVQPPATPEPRDAPRPGTHFLLEAYAGGHVYGGTGGHGNLLLGAGGKLPGLSLRFYLVGEFAVASASSDGVLTDSGLSFEDNRRSRDLTIGLRIYAPIGGPVRLFVDALGGSSHTTASLWRDDHQPTTASGWNPLGAVAAGFQVRFIHSMSAGARVCVRFTRDPLEDLREELQLATSSSVMVSAGLTWHF